jgi:hypothetical protein
MIIDVHRHLVAKDTVQGDYIRGAQKSFAVMYRKTYKVDITDKVVRPLIDQNGDNIIEEMDIPFADEEITQILGESARKALQL